jgi:hypothetical protein
MPALPPILFRVGSAFRPKLVQGSQVLQEAITQKTPAPEMDTRQAASTQYIRQFDRLNGLLF